MSSTERKKTYQIIEEYSEHAAVDGLVYIFLKGQRVTGKLFWAFVVSLLIGLGTLW